MAVSGENPRHPTGLRATPWSGLAASGRAAWQQGLAEAQGESGESSLDYAVIIPASRFPVGWVRFSAALRGYIFSTLMPGRDTSGDIHTEPTQAVPAWVGAHQLRKIHPIPESLTGDMMAAAPEMLLLLKMVQTLVDADVNIGLDGVHLREIIARAEGRG